MPQPQKAGRVTDTESHALFVYTNANEERPAAQDILKLLHIPLCCPSNLIRPYGSNE